MAMLVSFPFLPATGGSQPDILLINDLHLPYRALIYITAKQAVCKRQNLNIRCKTQSVLLGRKQKGFVCTYIVMYMYDK